MLKLTLLGLVSSFVFATPSPLNFEDDIDLFYLNFEKRMLCFSEADDRDGDHYADKSATPIWTFERGTDGFCPKGHLPFGNDCNDSDPAVHPFNEEKPFNDIDDDCDGRADEIFFEYTEDPALDTLRFRGTLGTSTPLPSNTQVQIAKLSAPDFIQTATAQIETHSSHFEVTVMGLAPETAYRARLFSNAGVSDWFYAVTSGESEIAQARAKITSLSLHEWNESELGKTGYAGSVDVDGTRYDASPGEWWCSEYYSWVGKFWVEKLEGLSYVGALRSFFRKYSSEYIASEIPEVGQMGDFLAMDTTGRGLFDHSGMLFAVEPGEPTILWTLEGNAGNKTQMKRRFLAPDRFYLGHLAADQL